MRYFNILMLTLITAFCTLNTSTLYPLQSSDQVTALETKLIRMVNDVRAKHGLQPTGMWDVLGYYARCHSQDMAAGKVKFGHGGFEQRAVGVQRYAQLDSMGENVAYFHNVNDPLQLAVEMWMKSPDHRKNILDSYRETGIGIAFDEDGRCYITQLFATRAKKD